MCGTLGPGWVWLDGGSGDKGLSKSIRRRDEHVRQVLAGTGGPTPAKRNRLVGTEVAPESLTDLSLRTMNGELGTSASYGP